MPAAFASAFATEGNAWSEAYGLARDAGGNSYVVGIFGRDAIGGTIDLDPSAGTLPLTSQGTYDGFVVKYAADGSVVWGRQLGGGGDAYDRTTAVVVGGDGNVHVGGNLNGTADLDPNVTYPDNRDLVGTTGVETAYLATFAPDGSLVRVWQSSGSTRLTSIKDLAVDGGGNLIAVGDYRVGDYAPRAVVKVSADMQLLWRNNYGVSNTGYFGPNAVAIDTAGNVHLAGELTGTSDVDATAGTFKLSSKNVTSTVVSKLTPAGGLVWAKQFTAARNSRVSGYDVAVDGSGNVYAAGYLERSGDFDPGAGTLTLTAPTGGGAFVTKLSSTGGLVWAKGLGGGSAYTSSANYELAVDAAGGVYLAGGFQGSRDFDTGPGTTVLTSSGGTDGFVLKLASSGDLAWAVRFGGSGYNDYPGGLVVDPNGDVFVCGTFTSAADFGDTTLTGPDYCFFFAKISQ